MVLVILAIIGSITAFLIYRALGVVSKKLDAAADNTIAFRKIDTALAQFVMLNKRLPCPASGTAHTGIEDPKVGAADLYKDCNTPSGVVPWSSLNLDKREAVDSWGRYIAYRVFDGSNGFTQTVGMAQGALANCLNESVTPVYALSGAGTTCNSSTHENSYSDFFAVYGITVNDMGTPKKVAYALISMGETGRGAYYPGGSAPIAAPSSSSNEFFNAGSLGTYWISARSDPSIAAESAAHFDDIVSYKSAADVVHDARLRPGAPWPLSVVFTKANAGMTGSSYNASSYPSTISTPGSYKIALSGGPVWVTAAGDSARNICAMNLTPQGISTCTTQTNGGDKLDSNTNERLTFDFRVTRKVAIVQLTDFKATGGGDKEQARITFYDATGAQVDQQTMAACATGGTRIGHATLTASGNFTKVEVRAIAKTGGGNSQFGVSAIMACKLPADCPTWSSSNPTVNYPSGWTQPVC